MNLLNGMERLAHEEEETPRHHHIVEVYRDPANRVIRFHLFITNNQAANSFAHFDVLSDSLKWETVHFLLPVPRVPEVAIAKLFVVAGGILNWPQFEKESS